MTASVGIHFPSVKPLFSCPPNPEVLKAWQAYQCQFELPESASISQKIIDNVNYVSFETFMTQLQATIAAFNQACDEPYILLITQDTLGKLDEGASEQWVSGLALEECGLRWPTAMTTSLSLDACLARHPQVRKILILDDAAYSGTHMARELFNLRNLRNVDSSSKYSFYFGIPFISKQSRRIVEEGPGSCKSNFTSVCLPHQTIPLIEDLLTEEEKKAAPRLDNLQLTVGLTYFDHKMPDYRSASTLLEQGIFLKPTMDCLMEIEHIIPGNRAPRPGKTRIETPEEWNERYNQFAANRYIPWIPKVICPYKLKNDEEQQALRKAVDSKRVGNRTSYSLPERFRVAREILGEETIQKQMDAPAKEISLNDIRQSYSRHASWYSIRKYSLFFFNTTKDAVIENMKNQARLNPHGASEKTLIEFGLN
ncbi:hypothetical protein [Legionella quinlivanii]|nr:hypothetical protein [Legionella quinlivanii]